MVVVGVRGGGEQTLLEWHMGGDQPQSTPGSLEGTQYNLISPPLLHKEGGEQVSGMM